MASSPTLDPFRQIQEMIVGDVKQQLDKRFSSLLKDLESTRQNTDGEIKKLVERLTELEKSNQSRSQDLADSFAKEHKSLRDLMQKKLADLSSRLDDLGSAKTDTQQLGDFLISWGEQVKLNGDADHE